MEVDLLDFVEQCRHLAKQALEKHAGEPASGVFARWVHVVLHCFRLEDGHSYRETSNQLRYMIEIRDVLGLDRDGLPEFTTIRRDHVIVGFGGEVFERVRIVDTQPEPDFDVFEKVDPL